MSNPNDNININPLSGPPSTQPGSTPRMAPARNPRLSKSQEHHNHHRIGSFVGSLRRQGLQLPPSKREREQARSLVFSDRLDHVPSGELDANGEDEEENLSQDGDGAVLEEGVFAPSETTRLHREQAELLERNGLLSADSVDREYYNSTSEAPPPGWDDAVLQGKLKTTPKLEARTLVTNSFPLAITFFLQYSLIMSSLFSVGHLGKVELGAVSLGAMTASITGIAFVQGMSTCLDTLCSQAFGAGRPDLVGLYFQKGVLVVMIGLLPVLTMWYRADLLLPYFVADEEDDTDKLIELATQYLRIMIFAMPGFTLFECGKRFLQAQNIFHASTYVLVICAPLNIFMTYTLVWNERFGMGFKGAPIAIAITNTLLALFLMLYVVLIDGRQCWSGFSRKVFSGWGPLVHLAIPGLIMVESEFLAYEIMTLAASYLGTSELAAQTIMSSITSLAYEIPFAVGCAASTRVANFIGAGAGSAAKTAAVIAATLGIIIGVIDSSVIYLLRYEFTSLFSSDPRVINQAAKYFPLCAIMHLLDATGAVMAGILRGQGRQRIGGFINLASYYLLGVPLGLFLCFGPLKVGLAGIWIGFSAALFAVVASFMVALKASRWNHYVDQARLRR